MKRAFAALLTVATLLIGCAPAATPAPTVAPAKAAAAATQPATAPSPTAKPAAAAPAASPKPSSAPLEKVKVMVPSTATSFLPAFMGSVNGTFKSEGIDLEVVVLQSNLGIAALQRGEVDYVDLLQPTLQAAYLGEPVRIIMGEKARTRWSIILGPGLNSPQEIKGKGFGLDSLGNFSHYAAKQSLAYFGLDPEKDVTFVVTTPGAASTAALQSGGVAAAIMSAPYSDQAIAAGYKEALNTADVFDIVTGGIGTTVKRIQENPDQVKRVMRAFLKSQAYLRDHQDETVKFAMSQFSLDQELATKVIASAVKEFGYNGNITDKGLSATLEVLRAGGGPAKDVTLEQLKKGVDLSFLPEVQKQLGLSN